VVSGGTGCIYVCVSCGCGCAGGTRGRMGERATHCGPEGVYEKMNRKSGEIKSSSSHLRMGEKPRSRTMGELYQNQSTETRFARLFRIQIGEKLSWWLTSFPSFGITLPT